LTDLHETPPPATAKDLRNFGFTFAGVALAFGALLLWKGRPSAPPFLVASALFLLVGALAPGLLRPVYGPWMKFAEVLGYVNTRILLGLFFLAGITPTGLIMRAAGKDPMGRTFKKKGAPSYWAKPDPHAHGNRHFDHQF
jgi:hypothetical protein